MKKLLLTALLLTGVVSMGQECSYGTVSENAANGGNISTGGAFEYSAASDFDVPYATLFTLNQVKFNALKGAADLAYVNLYILEDAQGRPGAALHTFENLIPTTQEFAYTTGIEDMDAYVITVDVPEPFALPTGKYYLQLRAAPGDEVAASWEITSETTTKLGRFDFSNFGDEPWFGGFSYYDYVFEVFGTCADTGEEQPEYGDPCTQGNEQNNHESGLNLRAGSLADDFIVAENTTFYLNHLKMATLQLGNVVNATIQIRRSEEGIPGEVIYSVANKAPKTENFFGYWPFDGFPLDVVAVDLEFEWDTPIELPAGTYFLEVSNVLSVPFTDFLAWEISSLPGIGGNAFQSSDGENWSEVPGYQLVFDVSGFCQETLGVGDLNPSQVGIYPNPVEDELHVDTNAEIKSITVVNLLGQRVIESKSNTNTLHTSALQDGVYLVKIELINGHLETFKIIKK